jgi:hypothetical protein
VILFCLVIPIVDPSYIKFIWCCGVALTTWSLVYTYTSVEREWMFSWSQIKHICANSLFSPLHPCSVSTSVGGVSGGGSQDSPRGSQRRLYRVPGGAWRW